MPSPDAIDLARAVLAALPPADPTCRCPRCDLVRRAGRVLEPVVEMPDDRTTQEMSLG